MVFLQVWLVIGFFPHQGFTFPWATLILHLWGQVAQAKHLLRIASSRSFQLEPPKVLYTNHKIIVSERHYPKREKHLIPVKGSFSPRNTALMVLSQKPPQGRYLLAVTESSSHGTALKLPPISSEITGCYIFMVLLGNLNHS